MNPCTAALICAILPLAGVAQQQAAPASAKNEDVVVFTNGEQLTGALEKADAAGITFKSAMAGEITVKWANVKEVRTDRQFALLTKGEKLTRRTAAGIVPSGRVTVEGKELTVATATGPRVVPVEEADRLVDAKAFDKAINHPPGVFEGWGGAASGGFSLVRATQNSTTFNGAVSLVRAVPLVTWLPARSRTTVDYTQSYGTVSQVGVDAIKTNIFHAAAEQDRYYSARAFAFGSVTFDHNFSLNLDLQSAYGGGIGLTIFKSAVRTFDVKADAHYETLRYFSTLEVPTALSQNQNLFGSTFSENYVRHLPLGLLLTEFGSFSPSWYQTSSSATQPNAYSAHVNGSLAFPIFKSLGFSLGAVDDYLNNAPVGSQRNSTQFTTNLTYTIKPR